ncbi:MAG: hypothetical protein PHV39_05940, partial [Methanomicrobium sp.]|nr:hypothetical protein [Methanomicrobium sp.]
NFYHLFSPKKRDPPSLTDIIISLHSGKKPVEGDEHLLINLFREQAEKQPVVVLTPHEFTLITIIPNNIFP